MDLGHHVVRPRGLDRLVDGDGLAVQLHLGLGRHGGHDLVLGDRTEERALVVDLGFDRDDLGDQGGGDLLGRFDFQNDARRRS